MIKFNVLEVNYCPETPQLWLSIAEVETINFDGALLHIEYDMGEWKFDILYLRSLVHKIQNKIQGG